jgi:hypothetical protein
MLQHVFGTSYENDLIIHIKTQLKTGLLTESNLSTTKHIVKKSIYRPIFMCDCRNLKRQPRIESLQKYFLLLR